MPDNVSDKLVDIITARAIDVERVKESIRGNLMARLRKLQQDLVGLVVALGPSETPVPSFREKRLRKLFEQTRLSLATGYVDLRVEHAESLKELAEIETQFALNALNQAIGVDIVTTALSPQQITEVTSQSLVFGAKSREWWMRQREATRRLFEDRVRVGVLRGDTTDEIVRVVRGTKRNNFVDGVMATPRRQAEALVRTSVQNAANAARMETFRQQDDLISGIEWVSTLDSRTTRICMALDGKVWEAGTMKPIGHDKKFPGPTAHWNCRSTQIAVVRSWDELNQGRKAPGGRKFENFFEDELRAQGLEGDQLAKAMAGTRASMDGQVTETTDFGAWLGRQPAERKNKLLGRERMRMFEAGQLTLEDLTDQFNRPLTLAELRERT